MDARWRKLLLFGALAVTVGVILLDEPAKAPELASAKTDRPTPRSGTTDPLALPERKRLARASGELFGAPPPKPVAPAPAAAAPVPVAPPVPYRFAGKLL